MNFLYCPILFSLLLLNRSIRTEFVVPTINLNEHDAYGSLLAINEYLSILAQNDQEHFTIITNPFTDRPNKCIVPYDTIQENFASLTRFVYSVVIGTKQNATQLVFSYIDENWQRDLFLAIVFLESTNIGCVRAVNRISINITDLNMQEHALLAMDPYGKRAYAVGTYYIVCIEIETSRNWQLNAEKLFDSGESLGNLFFPKAFVVTEDHFIFAVGQKFTDFEFLPYLIVLNLQSLDNATLVSTTELLRYNFGPSAIDITRYSTMSLSLLEQVEQFIIGIPVLDMLLFLSWNYMNKSKKPAIVRTHNSSQSGILFGKSVAFIDNNTFAVLAQTLSTLPWSTSQIQVYSLYDESANNRPLIVYPNNQQIIPSMDSVSSAHSILTIISWESHLGIALDAGAALLLSSSPPGNCSAQIDDTLLDIGVYTSMPCIAGTARNTTSFGPCFLCPPNTKNNGTTGINCERCATDDSLLCLRGSLVEVDLAQVMDYNQAVLYPHSPDLVVFDDILIANIFRFMTNSFHCLIISPLFWTLLAVGLACVIFIVMSILICYPRWKPHRTFLKKLFKHMDLLGENELWFGGLLTFAIVVLVVFTCRFSVSFSRLYPIEIVSSNVETTGSCESIPPNAKFSSFLQLLSVVQHEKEKPILTLLDKQDITLTVHFVSTSFPCHSVSLQENFDRGQRTPLHNLNCSYNGETSILTVSTLLHHHLINLEFDLVGPYFIGGIRMCLSGQSSVQENDQFKVQELRFCQLFYIDNETLTINPTVGIKMTKIVNRTVGYQTSDEMIFSGMWIPTLTVNTLSDVLFFGESGEYIRYLSDRVTLMVDITESEFFMMNTQEPIARRNEIVLHTILFTIVFLELFGLFFLFVKLTIVRLINLIQRRFFSNKDRYRDSNEEQVQHTEVVQPHTNEPSTKCNNVNDEDITVWTSL